MNEECFYIKDDSNYFIEYNLLKLTGRWKISFVPEHNVPILYIEHQGKFFKKWISEMDIIVGYKSIEYINTSESIWHRYGQKHMFSNIGKVITVKLQDYEI